MWLFWLWIWVCHAVRRKHSAERGRLETAVETATHGGTAQWEDPEPACRHSTGENRLEQVPASPLPTHSSPACGC